MKRLVAFAFALAACTGDNRVEPLPFQVTIAASQLTASPAEEIEFVVNAQGGSLVGIVMDFGDGTMDQFSTAGARTARVPFVHAFETAGSYTVQATVTEAVEGSKTATVAVTVNQP